MEEVKLSRFHKVLDVDVGFGFFFEPELLPVSKPSWIPVVGTLHKIHIKILRQDLLSHSPLTLSNIAILSLFPTCVKIVQMNLKAH